MKKKEKENNKQPEYLNYSDEEQVLDLNELMDVQGGIDDEELSQCGLRSEEHTSELQSPQ